MRNTEYIASNGISYSLNDNSLLTTKDVKGDVRTFGIISRSLSSLEGCIVQDFSGRMLLDYQKIDDGYVEVRDKVYVLSLMV